MLASTGGHYTSYVNQDEDKKRDWYECNDGSVSKCDKKEIISKEAYILFYKKKEFSASNIINLTSP